MRVVGDVAEAAVKTVMAAVGVGAEGAGVAAGVAAAAEAGERVGVMEGETSQTTLVGAAMAVPAKREAAKVNS